MSRGVQQQARLQQPQQLMGVRLPWDQLLLRCRGWRIRAAVCWTTWRGQECGSTAQQVCAFVYIRKPLAGGRPLAPDTFLSCATRQKCVGNQHNNLFEPGAGLTYATAPTTPACLCAVR